MILFPLSAIAAASAAAYSRKTTTPTMIPTTPIESSQIAEIGHDPQTNTLAIKFKTGDIYHYANFSGADFEAFRNAPSIGSHFYNHIKRFPTKFPYTKQ